MNGSGRRRDAFAALALCAATLAVACGGSSSSSQATADTLPPDFGAPVDMRGKKEITITMGDNNYDPKVVTVSPGTKLTFTNGGRNPHNVYPAKEGMLAPIQNLDAGQSGSTVAPSAPGQVLYYCSVHGTPQRGKRGAIVVAP